jgi:UPF0176 protein
MVQIITFYGFKDMCSAGDLIELRDQLRESMREHDILGTIIIAEEGFNASVCGAHSDIAEFVQIASAVLQTGFEFKSSYHDVAPFKKIDVKVKPEIVTLKKPVEISNGVGTHVKPEDWNDLIADPDVFVLDTRNDYEFRSGTFDRAVNPGTEKFSDLPHFITENLDPGTHKKIAMFCTGGIRCEKFAPYMKGLGFENVYQLEGGILKYLETVPPKKQLWRGECYVFDKRVSVNERLEKGVSGDLSQAAED